MIWTPVHAWLLEELTRAIKNAHLHRHGRSHRPSFRDRGGIWQHGSPWPDLELCGKCLRTCCRVAAAFLICGEAFS